LLQNRGVGPHRLADSEKETGKSQPGKFSKRLPNQLPEAVTMRTAVDVTGVSEGRIRYWAAQGKLRVYDVEGVGTPRYDLEQLQALARGEPSSPPPGGGLRDMEAAGQLVLALDIVEDAIDGLDGETAALLRPALALARVRLALCYKRRGWYELPRAA
jgi:hypothetical protein